MPNMISGILKKIKVGTQVSHMWLCPPSIFSPTVGPSVLSLAGEPASPIPAATPMIKIVAAVLKPNCAASGQ